MTHLLDTDCIINHLRGKKEIIRGSDTSYAISVVTLGELFYGANRSVNPKATHEAVDAFRAEFNVTILDITEKVMAQYARIKALLSQRGALIEDFDLLIAATAIEHHLTLVTANKKHFTRIHGLSLT
ncbi:MAG: type II toxin-antitoxin system VapC family toxin [Patescibacteria group bacterium]